MFTYEELHQQLVNAVTLLTAREQQLSELAQSEHRELNTKVEEMRVRFSAATEKIKQNAYRYAVLRANLERFGIYLSEEQLDMECDGLIEQNNATNVHHI